MKNPEHWEETDGTQSNVLTYMQLYSQKDERENEAEPIFEELMTKSFPKQKDTNLTSEANKL